MTTAVSVVVVEAEGGAGLTGLIDPLHDVVLLAVVDHPAAVDAVRRHRPDVVVVDVSAPAALRTVEAVMGFEPVPILAVGAADEDAASAIAVQAMVAGAADVVPRPSIDDPAAGVDLVRRLRQLRGVHVVRHPRARMGARAASAGGEQAPVVAIAASTGGPQAIATVLSGMTDVPAAVLVVQHLHPDFTAGFAEWLAGQTRLPVGLAGDGRDLVAGTVLVAPGNRHLAMSAGWRVALRSEPASLHRPSADVLFSSVAAVAGPRAVGVVLTGMGGDGAEGLLRMRESGAMTLGQDRETCAVYGMPAVAAQRGALGRVVPLDGMADAIRRTVARIPR